MFCCAASEMDILVGFRFHPTDEEIIHLLGEKRRDPRITVNAIFETNIYDFEPPELSKLSPIQSDKKWCSFFTTPNYINSNRKRVYRATKTGYWKLTGEGYPIKDTHSKREIGYKRVLVFYERPGGCKEIKTNWVMHQFSAADSPVYEEDFVVCRVKKQGNKKRCASTNVEDQQQKKLRVLTNIQDHPSHDMTLDTGNSSPELQLPVVGNTFPELPLPVENTTPNLQFPDVENTYLELPAVGNTFPQFHSLIAELPSDCSVYNIAHDATENTFQVDPPHLTTLNALCGYQGLVHSSFSAVNSPEQESPGSGVSTDDYNVQDVYPSEEHGDSTLHFESSKSSPGFCGGVRNEADAEFPKWLQDMFEYDSITCGNCNAIMNY